MPKNKMVTKPCPECQQQVPVACKACPCGHVFFTTRRAISVHKASGQTSNRNEEEQPSDAAGGGEGTAEGGETVGTKPCRRTERVRRERPNYFGTTATQQQIENRIKTLKRKSKPRTGNSTSSSTNEMEGDASNGEEGMVIMSHHGHSNSSAGGPSKKRGRPPKNASKDKVTEKQVVEKVDEKDLLANISAEKSLQLAIVLAEINRKMGAQQFKIPA